MSVRPARRTLATLAATALAVLGASPANAEGSTYVALGDSWSSGTGTGRYLDDGTSCQRSVHAYPALLAAAKGYSLTFRACSGATTADVTALQLPAVGHDTARVSLTVGGNDAGFARVLTECAKPAWASNCHAAIDRAVGIIDHQLPGRLASLYGAVRDRAPQATIVVTGYPRIFNGEDCNAFTWFSPTEQSRLNATADRLNTRIATAASAAGVRYAHPTTPFLGHAVCADVEWINGLSSPVSESYHPNRRGHSSGYAPLVGGQLTGSVVTIGPTAVRLAAASADQLAARQRPYAALDRTIEPKPFRVPDLTSPRMEAAAARAGVDLHSRASIDAADRAHEARRAGIRVGRDDLSEGSGSGRAR